MISFFVQLACREFNSEHIQFERHPNERFKQLLRKFYNANPHENFKEKLAKHH